MPPSESTLQRSQPSTPPPAVVLIISTPIASNVRCSISVLENSSLDDYIIGMSLMKRARLEENCLNSSSWCPITSRNDNYCESQCAFMAVAKSYIYHNNANYTIIVLIISPPNLQLASQSAHSSSCPTLPGASPLRPPERRSWPSPPSSRPS